MKPRHRFIVAGVLVLGSVACSGGKTPRETPSPTPSPSPPPTASAIPDLEGYVLPASQPKDCEFATGDLVPTQAKENFAALVSDSDLDPDEEIDAIVVGVAASEADRAISPQEQKTQEERRIGDRTVRVETTEGITTIDWHEDGWLTTLRAEPARVQQAEEIAETIRLPRAPGKNGGEATDTKITPPDGMEVVMERGDQAPADTYIVTAGRCAGTEYVGTMIVQLYEGRTDPRWRITTPGKTEKVSRGGREYWVNERQIVWQRDAALISAVVGPADSDRLAFAGSVRSATREEVAKWIRDSKDPALN